MEYDALIVGARAAGASLAILLAKQGLKVLMVDRDRFPSDTLSTHFMAFTEVDSLRRLGVLEDVEAAGFRRVLRSRTWVEDVCLEVPAGPPGAFSLAPRRDVLDSILIKHAVAAGAEFAERTRAESVLRDGERVAGAVIRPADGEPREVAARVVVGADGKFSKVAEWVGSERYNETPPIRPVYYAYLNGVKPQPETTLEMWFHRNQIGFLFPMRPDEDLVALEVQPSDFEEFRADPEGTFWRRLRDLPSLGPRVTEARLEGKVQGTKGIENYFRKPYGPGWVLTGDAGFLKDPCTGLGIGDALHQSFLLARAFELWREGRDWEVAMAGFQERRDRFLGIRYFHTIEAAKLADGEGAHRLDVVRALGINPHLGRVLLEALPRLLDQAFDPVQLAMTEFVRTSYEPAETATT
jgi:flavin-dependent dehydrogenase